MQKIVNDISVWDLHVHTTYKYNKSANSYVDEVGNEDTNEEYVEKIINIIKKCKYNFRMISFTDHNFINLDIYKLFNEKKKNLDITLLPGVEVDAFLNPDDKITKHIIFYFPEDISLEKLELVNNIIKNKQKESKGVYFDDFINELFINDFYFAISPHAFKQDKRAIEYDWNDDDDLKNRNRIKLYSSSLFVFWEADKSSIAKAKDFISYYYDDSENSITNFSDSHNYKTFENYINNPSQFFLSLNNFKGLLMASSEPDRILTESNYICTDQYIDEIEIFNQNIKFSKKMNVIIGGRGKGKSLLLDKIALYFNGTNFSKNSARKKFLDKINFKIYKDNSTMTKNFEITYLNQMFIDNLFTDKSSNKLNDYFNEEFSKITIMSPLNNLRVKIGKIEYLKSNGKINICSLKNDLKLITYDKLIKNIYKKDDSSKELPLAVEKYGETISYYQSIMNIIPKEIQSKSVKDKVSDLVIQLLIEIIDYNVPLYKKKILNNIMHDCIDNQNNLNSEENKNKIDLLNNISKKIDNEYIKYINDIKLINELYDVDKSKTDLNIKYNKYNGCDDNFFYFVKSINMEHPVEFAKRILIESFNGRIITNKSNLDNKNIFKKFIFSDDTIYNSNINRSSIINKIKELDGIHCDEELKIIYYSKNNDRFLDLSLESPGTQTNAIMEYVINKKTKVPLFIDQPEDNVDNEARFKYLTKWFKNIKNKRQVFLVTHDANIVVNGDAENVIIANYINDNFVYEYGALESSDTVEKAATILDGGKNAIARRMHKYGC